MPYSSASAGFSVPVPQSKPSLAQNAFFIVPRPKPEKHAADEWRLTPILASLSEAGLILPPSKKNVDGVFPDTKPVVADSAEALLSFGLAPVPKSKPFRDGEMSDADMARYKRIFAKQAQGDMRAAQKEIERLSNMDLRGHVLYQRYMHPTAYRSSFEELRNWLDLYADHPGAERVYKLALERAPKDYEDGINKPKAARGIARLADPSVASAKRYISNKERSSAQKRAVKDIQHKVRRYVSRGAPTAALKFMRSEAVKNKLDKVEEDQLYALISRGYFQAAKYQEAYQIAAKAALRSGTKVPIAAWMAGLIDFMQEDYKQAAVFFEMTGESPYVTGWAQAAGSYWAARSHMRADNGRAVKAWLRKAAAHPRTFYGLLAAKALGQDLEFYWDVPSFEEAHRDTLTQTAAGKRAVLLQKVGRTDLAERELIRLNPEPGSALRDAMLAYAHEAGLPRLSMRLGNAMSRQDGKLYDAALYPLNPWEPEEGYRVDPALLHAIMRQESRFDPKAKSPSGAAGLMQIMPATAHYVAGGRVGSAALLNPAKNLEIGQRYLEKLLYNSAVDGDVVDALIAYNAGPGNLRRWKKRIPSDDPLLFIEGIPAAETRAYVERVLSNYWIYRKRAGQETPTLTALANGQEANYALVSGDRDYEFAQADTRVEPSPKPQLSAFRSLGWND